MTSLEVVPAGSRSKHRLVWQILPCAVQTTGTYSAQGFSHQGYGVAAFPANNKYRGRSFEKLRHLNSCWSVQLGQKGMVSHLLGLREIGKLNGPVSSRNLHHRNFRSAHRRVRLEEVWGTCSWLCSRSAYGNPIEQCEGRVRPRGSSIGLHTQRSPVYLL